MKTKLASLCRMSGLALAVIVAATAPSIAAVPATTDIEGVLLSTGGSPAADGNYTVKFAIYASETGGTPVWSESGVTLAAKGGQFNYLLGSKTPLTAASLNLAKAWFGIQIGADPELPRKPLGSSLYALRAAVAESLECSGCLKAGTLDAAVLQPYAKSADLSGYAKTADLSAYAKVVDLSAYAKKTDLSSYATVAALADYVKASSLAKVAGTGSYADLTNKPTLAAVAASGSYADLTNKPVLAKLGLACGTNLVLKGIKADGSYECASAGIAPDMINEISNDLIWNQFVDSKSGATDVQIKDGFSAGVTDTLNFPDVGLVEKIWVNFSGLNSDMTKVIVELYGPGMSSPYILYNGGKSGTSLVAKYNDGDALVSGDMNKDWLNKNIKGNWSLTVKDIAAIQVPPGTPPFTYDGKFNWTINIQTLSSKKIQIKGNLIVDGSLSMGNGAVVSGNVTFKDNVDFQNSWCPARPDGTPSHVLGGVCYAGSYSYRTWPESVALCSALKADVCSSAQSLVLRRQGILPNYTHYGNWTNSWGDNDSGYLNEAVGNIGDDHSAGERWAVACCYNSTPSRATDQVVKVGSGDKGVRVLKIHNVANTTFQAAAAECATMNADLCDKSQLVYLRSAGKISANFFWPNDGEDTDGANDYGTAGGSTMPNDVHHSQHPGAFACCAGERTTLACPAGTTDVAGVCMVSVNNSGANWQTAAKDCTAKGAHICSVSQNSVLRLNSKITHSSSWSHGMNDCDGQCSGTYGNGSVANNINPNSSYGYACCL